MRYHQVMSYDAPARVVYAMLTDPAFQRQRCRAGDPVDADSAVEQGPGDGATVTVTRRMAIDPPGFVKRFTGAELTVAETQCWQDSNGSAQVRQGTLVVEVRSQPAEVDGTLQLVDADGGATVTVDAEVNVRVPLIAGKVEGYITDLLDRILAAEQELGRAWLDGTARGRGRR